MKKTASGALPISAEISAQLYVGDYFGDTLLLSAREHAALGALLLHIWLRGPVWRFARTAGLDPSEWRTMRDAILPLYRRAEGNIQERKRSLHAYDGKRLPSSEWFIVKTIVLARDKGVCTYCGSETKPHVDHIVPISRGGSNDFINLTTSCGPCNQSKGPKLLSEWHSTRYPPQP